MESYINVDKNMIVNTTIGDAEVVWLDARQEPFAIHGLYNPYEGEYFRRLPPEVAEATSPGVNLLSRESAGGRVRFSTDSPYIAIRAKFRVVGRSSHLTLISSSGFDLYIDGEFGSRFVKEFRMVYDMTDRYEQIVYLEAPVMRSYTVNFPVHAVVESLEIGLKPGSALDRARPYRDIAPVLFYGSSIVHGTGACRPGNTYPAMISRALNVDYYNIGFSGQAKGETAITEYMAGLPMSVFVCDYDHNAPTPEHLAATHYRMYEIIRAKNPDLPYIMITRPDYWTMICDRKTILRRRDIIMESYLKARASGDENVHFIDGLSFNAGPHQYEMTLDGCHPNDVGFVSMANNIGAFIRHILEAKA
ncbi:MAG: hypothetical protein IKD45_02665 [Clostridia bacterium]|nr:hypothetical protein [Clostridia bacterium]